MIIRMAKVEIVGPKQDLLATLDLLHNRGIFQPDPQLLERVELARDARLNTLVLNEHELHERSYFKDLYERVSILLELLPETTDAISPIQSLPAMDLVDELVDQHLAKVREQDRILTDYRKDVEDLQRDLAFWQALEPLLADLPQDSNLELLGITIRDTRQLQALEELLQQRTGGRCHISSTTTTDGTLIGLVATDRQIAGDLHQALTDERIPEMSLPAELANLTLTERIAALHERLQTATANCRKIETQMLELSRRWRPVYRRALVWLEERLTLYRATATAYTTRLCFKKRKEIISIAIGMIQCQEMSSPMLTML